MSVFFFISGSCQEKLQTIFGMFDVEGRGFLQKADLSRMFRYIAVIKMKSCPYKQKIFKYSSLNKKTILYNNVKIPSSVELVSAVL